MRETLALRLKWHLTVVTAGFILLSFGVFMLRKNHESKREFSNRFTNLTFDLNFIPKDLEYCEDLFSFSSSSASTSSPRHKSYNISDNYYLHRPAFQEAVDKCIREAERIDGHSDQLKEQAMALHHLAGHSFVRTVCETGFNLGHSSFNYLTANQHLSVYSFDIGSYEYTRHIYAFLKTRFPGRLSVMFGNSKDTIPRFIEENPNVRCDVILVDGGHRYPVVLADILNFARMAVLDRNVIVFDDFPTSWGARFGKAWTDALAMGIVKEVTRCTFRNLVDGLDRGFIIGRVLRRP